MINSTAIDDGAGNKTTYSEQCVNQTQLDLFQAKKSQLMEHLDLEFNDKKKDGEFVWDSYTQGIIMGSFFWGYIITQSNQTTIVVESLPCSSNAVPGGRMAEKFGSKRLLAASVLLTSILTIISPWAAKAHYIAFMVTRALEGDI